MSLNVLQILFDKVQDVNSQSDADEQISFRSTMVVELVKCSASDADVLFAARVSTIGESTLERLDEDPSRSEGLIRYLMRDRHGSPFEHNSITFFVSAPIFVFREFMRHRIASYNEESGRYRTLKPVFYVPDYDRPLIQQGKPGSYEFIAGDTAQTELAQQEIKTVSTIAFASYKKMLDKGIAREVARAVLPLNTYSSMYVTMNARALMNFLSLRVKSDQSTYPSFPQYEIDLVAQKMEKVFQNLMPITHKFFVELGRVAP